MTRRRSFRTSVAASVGAGAGVVGATLWQRVPPDHEVVKQGDTLVSIGLPEWGLWTTESNGQVWLKEVLDD